MKLHLLKTREGFYCAHASDKDEFDRLKNGEVYEATITKPRNYMFHRKFFALLKIGFESQRTFEAFDWYRSWVIMKAGHYESKKAPNGTWMFLPKSISFDNMDETEFEQLFKDVQNTIIRENKITREQIEENLTLFL